MDFNSPEFWIALGQIIMIDILLGGDNAVVIALASRRLPDAQRKQAIFWGIFGAVALRVILIFFALQLLKILVTTHCFFDGQCVFLWSASASACKTN